MRPTRATPQTAARQAPLSTGFSRQEHWSGLPCPPPGDLPNPGVEPGSPALQAGSLPTELRGKPDLILRACFLRHQQRCPRGQRSPPYSRARSFANTRRVRRRTRGTAYPRKSAPAADESAVPRGPSSGPTPLAGEVGQDSGRWEGGCGRDPEAVGHLDRLGRRADLCSENYRILQERWNAKETLSVEVTRWC